MHKKTLWKSQKTEWKSLDTRRRARCKSYSILFDLCGSHGFNHRFQNKKNRVRLFISTLLAEKSAFSRCVIHNWEEIESLKMKKSWKSPLILFSHFHTNPVLTLCLACCRWVVLSLNCFVPIHMTVMLTVCYINRQSGRGYHYSDTNSWGESATGKKLILR